MMKNKKGIAPVIATVLLIVIVIAGVALIISFLIPFMQEQMGGAELCYNARVEIKEADSCYNSDQLIVKVSRGAQEFELSDIILKVSTATETRTKRISLDLYEEVPENPHEENTYSIDRTVVSDATQEITSIAIAPIVKSGTTEKICEVTSEIAIVCCIGDLCVEGGTSVS